MRIAFVISSMAPGGAERVAATLCSVWLTAGHDVHLVTLEAPGTASHWPLDAKIVRHQLDLLRPSKGRLDSMRMTMRRVLQVRRALRRIAPDVVLSFMPENNILALLASIGAAWPTIVSERIHPAYLPSRRSRLFLLRMLYPRAAAVVAQTATIADYIKRVFGGHTAVIPNPIDLASFQGRPVALARDRLRIVAVGRLEPQKGFDLLIEAFASLAAKHPSWDLAIYGEGGGRCDLEAQLTQHGLAGRVNLPGIVDDIVPQLQTADLFVHAARFEGFPNAVVEALAAGLPVIASDSPGAAGELLGRGEFGLLVPVDDAGALAIAMDRLMSDQAARKTYASVAAGAVAHLGVDGIAARWIELFRERVDTTRPAP